MITRMILIAKRPYTLLFLRSHEEAQAVADMYLHSEKGKEAFLADFGTNPPRVKGSCYPHHQLLVCTVSGNIGSIVNNILHEVAHAWLFELGLDWQNETLTETLAEGFGYLRDAYFFEFLLKPEHQRDKPNECS